MENNVEKYDVLVCWLYVVVCLWSEYYMKKYLSMELGVEKYSWFE